MVSPSPLSGAARRVCRGRALTTRCSVPFLQDCAPPQVIQGATTGRRAIAGRRRATGLEIAGRLHLRSAMLDAAYASRSVSSSRQVRDDIWLFYLVLGGSGVFGVTSKAVMGSDEVFVGGG
ncbi:hypothetical protein NDU88_001082 [Pleurodeles waltl]|uniref:Uncharacterized protein n=1 Tax=Pleurodeles waltl TaxID=8319 RepID=A0AAV7WKV6_PLEWA|nr:hypothetical protein NDU88_001082 [Pleurodeles waltl]